MSIKSTEKSSPTSFKNKDVLDLSFISDWRKEGKILAKKRFSSALWMNCGAVIEWATLL